jgi:hypothetical protein
MIGLLLPVPVVVADITVQAIQRLKEVAQEEGQPVVQDFIAAAKALVMQVAEEPNLQAECEEIAPMAKMGALDLVANLQAVVVSIAVAEEAAGMVAVELILQAAVEDRVILSLPQPMLPIPKVFKQAMEPFLLHGKL